MFSPRLFAVCAILATAVAVPVTEQPAPQPITSIYSEDFESQSPWLGFPIFGNLFAPLWKLFPTFAEIGPRIIADDDKFQVVVNVKDYKKDDLKVKVKGDFIFIQGSHEAKQDDRDVFASQFFHTYTLPTNSSGTEVVAELSNDGNLVVTAPVTANVVDKAKEVDREVPIVETGKPYKEDKVEKINVQPTLTTTVAEEDDKKEPTTASIKEDVTEKDNVIPHGNEVNI